MKISSPQKLAKKSSQENGQKNSFFKARQLSQFFALTFLFIFAFCKASLAWYGFDYDAKTTIEIEEGNLVRPGLVIDYYDLKADEVKSAKILYMESAPAGLEMKLQDIFTKEERIVYMKED